MIEFIVTYVSEYSPGKFTVEHLKVQADYHHEAIAAARECLCNPHNVKVINCVPMSYLENVLPTIKASH